MEIAAKDRAEFEADLADHLMRAGGVFNWPDTFPLFARDEMRELLASALDSSGESENLADWKAITATSNKAKNQIPPLERRFWFQHYWRLLRERHPDAFHRRIQRVERAFAEFLGVNEATVRLDRSNEFVTLHLQNAWIIRALDDQHRLDDVAGVEQR